MVKVFVGALEVVSGAHKVGGLPASVDTEMLKGYFQQYGSIEVLQASLGVGVEDAVVMVDPQTERLRPWNDLEDLPMNVF